MQKMQKKKWVAVSIEYYQIIKIPCLPVFCVFFHHSSKGKYSFFSLLSRKLV
uniref:Uncharacterized protein n=1 Tax=Glossina morsitans morsitans TaxID=37546 RepID=A0A1B0G313_GLOMM